MHKTVTYIVLKVEDYIASGVLEQYVLGALSAEEAARVASMAARYEEVRYEIARIQYTLQDMAEELAINPPPQVLDKIKEKISRQEATAKSSSPKKKVHYLQYGIAATFTLKLVVMAMAFHFWTQWKTTENRLTQMQHRYENLAKEARQTTQALVAVSDPAFQTIALSEPGTAAGSQVLVYWNEKTQEIYINPSQLPANPSGRQYQLWGMVDGKPVSLGVFDVKGNLPQMIPMEGVAGITGFAVTLEPTGGSGSPDKQKGYYH